MSKKNLIKVILLGESGVGKTCLIHSYLGIQMKEVLSNVSFESYKKEITKNNITYTVQLWDTAGQERFRSISKIFIKESQIVIFVYDITNKKSFDELPFWVKYVEELLGKHVVFGLIGNKIDLFDSIDNEKGLVEAELGKKYASDIGALFSEVSAKVNPKGFEKYINELINIFLSRRNSTEREWEVMTLKNVKKKAKMKKCC